MNEFLLGCGAMLAYLLAFLGLAWLNSRLVVWIPARLWRLVAYGAVQLLAALPGVALYAVLMAILFAWPGWLITLTCIPVAWPLILLLIVLSDHLATVFPHYRLEAHSLDDLANFSEALRRRMAEQATQGASER